MPQTTQPAQRANVEPARPSAPTTPAAGHVDMADERTVQQWCDHFGITRQQLEEAVKAVGTGFEALKRHLLTQGASAGPS